MLPRARQEHLTIQEVADELVIYDHSLHRLHRLNRTTALVWRHCDGRTSVGELAAMLALKVGLPADEQLAWLALDQLDRAQLLREPLARSVGTQRVTRRQAIGLGVAGAMALLLPGCDSATAPSPGLAMSRALQNDCDPNSCDGLCDFGRGKCVGGGGVPCECQPLECGDAADAHCLGKCNPNLPGGPCRFVGETGTCTCEPPCECDPPFGCGEGRKCVETELGRCSCVCVCTPPCGPGTYCDDIAPGECGCVPNPAPCICNPNPCPQGHHCEQFTDGTCACVPDPVSCIRGLVNTGVSCNTSGCNAVCTALPERCVEEFHYQVFYRGLPGQFPHVLVLRPNQWFKPPTSLNAKWISPACTPAFFDGLYRYNLQFFLQGVKNETVIIYGCVAADNSVQIELDGVRAPFQSPPDAHRTCLDFFIPAVVLVPGVHYLSFLVYNRPGPQNNPTGLLVANLQGFIVR